MESGQPIAAIKQRAIRIPTASSPTRRPARSMTKLRLMVLLDVPLRGKMRDHACDTFMPAGVDYTLQAGDVWFWMPSQRLRPLSELILQYHLSVGRNTVLELDFAIDRSGRRSNPRRSLSQIWRLIKDLLRQARGECRSGCAWCLLF